MPKSFNYACDNNNQESEHNIWLNSIFFKINPAHLIDNFGIDV